jgi:hypothetical protein
MKRHCRMKPYSRLMMVAMALGLTGCADDLPSVLRDYYNVQNEVIDHMVTVCDEDSAKRFNEMLKTRLKPKEDQLRERLDKLNRQQVTQTDKKLFDELHIKLETEDFKHELGGIDTRYYKEVARIRRIIVKLAEDKAEEMKSLDKTFEVVASQAWPNLSNLEKPDKFSSSSGLGGFAAPKAQADPGGGPPGMPGGGIMGMMPGAGGGGGNNLANANLTFSMLCERIGQKDWKVTRRWRSGGTTVEKLEINGVNLVPMFSAG